jgi:hypothetical protein
MPRRKIHKDVSLIVLGKSFPEVDKVLDLPAKFMGASHRKVLHSIPEGVILGLLLTGDFDGAMAGALHVIVDVVDSGAKKEIRNFAKNRGDTNVGKKEKEKPKKQSRIDVPDRL